MRPLYAIQSDLFSLLNLLDKEPDPLRYELLLVEIAKLQIDKSVKLEGCCTYYNELRSEGVKIEAEIARLKSRLKSLERKEESFAEYLRGCLPNQETSHSTLYDISWRKSEAVEITDPSLIPPQYLREKITYEPDKAQAKLDLKMGAVIPGFQLVVRQNIQVK